MLCCCYPERGFRCCCWFSTMGTFSISLCMNTFFSSNYKPSALLTSLKCYNEKRFMIRVVMSLFQLPIRKKLCYFFGDTMMPVHGLARRTDFNQCLCHKASHVAWDWKLLNSSSKFTTIIVRMPLNITTCELLNNCHIIRFALKM